jgi:cyclic beta-1,2-glucan synthetase
VDLVVVRAGASGYVEVLRDELVEKLSATGGASVGQRAGVHLVFADQVPPEELRLLECAARVILDEGRPLSEQLRDARRPPPVPPQFVPPEAGIPHAASEPLSRPENLRFDNGLGGFSGDGREYVVFLPSDVSTPAPWSNVLANDEFGSLVTESGLGFTWAVNSGENRLTRWSNDPVLDVSGEVLYLRDEQTGATWTPTPRPAGAASACEVRHGAGVTTWRRRDHDLEQELRVFVPPDAPVKVARLRLVNRTARPRRITATYWAEWLLGALPSVSRPHVIGEWAPDGPALLARNPWNVDFAERVAFLTATRPPHGISGDRREFLGPNGDVDRPAALRRWGLSGRVEPGADAGAAYQVHLDLEPSGTQDVSFVLGQGRDRPAALALVAAWRSPERIARGDAEREAAWEQRLGAVQVRTPDAALDLLANRWLLLQTLASRVMARAGFHQAGGAYGFRDQLQDVLALLYADPARAREHLLRCAAHEFEAGDVLHWWHPPADRGVRTRCSDDLLWLPWAVSHYVAATGDLAVLDERVPFLTAPELRPDEHDRYARFEASSSTRSLFEHCERALERGVTSGRHGLPRLGTGDWNDGFDRLGARGEGESVWLGWFALAAMRRFADVCERKRDPALAEHWRARAGALEAALARTPWDGGWYLRAFDDDGRPVGSHLDPECRIDSIAQSWAVLSGAETHGRAREAVLAARRELAGAEHDLVRLFWPPFDSTPREPGYVKAYPPGVRENGGQYAHAAAWLGLALAELGEADAALEIFGRIHPIHRTATPAGVAHYRGEPYVLAGDVASAPPHGGRAGWTWYTGAAGWSYRLAVEGILGLRLRDGKLALQPCLPHAWPGFEAELRGPHGSLCVRVVVEPELAPGARELCVDGVRADDEPVAFPTAGGTRRIELRIGAAPEDERAVREATTRAAPGART